MDKTIKSTEKALFLGMNSFSGKYYSLRLETVSLLELYFVHRIPSQD